MCPALFDASIVVYVEERSDMGYGRKDTMGASENIKAKNLGSPDEPYTVEHSKMEIANIDEFPAGRITLEQAGSGCRPAVQPLAQTPSCQVQHWGM